MEFLKSKTGKQLLMTGIFLIIAIVITIGIIIFILIILAILDSVYVPKGCTSLDIPFSTTTLRVQQFLYQPYQQTSDDKGEILGYSRQRTFSNVFILIIRLFYISSY